MTPGAWILFATLALALAFGAWRRTRDGRFRPTRPTSPLVAEARQPDPRVVEEPRQPSPRLVEEPRQPDPRVVEEARQGRLETDQPHQPDPRVVEEAHQAELRVFEEARQAELRVVEEARQAELRVVEEARQAELRVVEEARQAELRVVEEARQGRLETPATQPPTSLLTHTPYDAQRGERATLLQFSSAFCAPCRATRRVLADIAEVVPGVTHVEVDAEEQLDLVRRLGILRTPTTLLLDADGREVTRAAGAPRKEQVLSALAEAGLR